ncbi:MAG: hypothetical protein SCARUB_01013 [Candidatus Scalindua rubra]|uniref:DUF1640 domain-containing protein n=1 Tax=Candidatus Scalindua rubra TaxID=1872076 RepID=A0A1E3XDZ7_9BACT|nr:MAG: hypothetical protein SCARUB_01013 [Candidatus Scalindua rubra]
MSDAAMFDTLAYAKKLKSAGFTEEQAEIQAEALAGIIDEKLATKQDIRDLSRDIKEMEIRLKHDLTLRLGAMLAAGMAIIATIVKLIS